MLDGATYREFSPVSELEAEVGCVWVLRADAPRATPCIRRSLSKATVDLIIALRGHFCQTAEDRLFGKGPARSYLVGPLSIPALTHATSPCIVLGVHFRPGGARAFFPIAMHEVADLAIALADAASPLARAIEGVVDEQEEPERQLFLVQKVLARARLGRASGAVARAVTMIQSRRGAVSIAEIAGASGMGVRQLERRFRADVGVGPKLVCRIERVRHAVALLDTERHPSLSEIAIRTGFYDQAHFIREVSAIAGTTPRALVAERSHGAGSDRVSCPRDALASAANASGAAGARHASA